MSFDARPLTDPVDPRAVRAFAAELRARGATAMSGAAVFAIVVVALMAVIIVPTLASVMIAVVSSSGRGLGWGVIPFALVGIAVALGIVLSLVGWRRSRVTRYRLNRFAQANGMAYLARIADPPLPGMIFGMGRSRASSDVVRGTRPRFAEFGNYQYTTGSGKNSTTHHWGYVAVKLDVPLPNIVLDAKGNNSFGSNLPASFRKAQRLSLEGDFDRYFDLYCPEGYERDALYLFTPDIMARFVDNAAQLDVEIVDDWLFLYTQRKVSTLDPATWAWLFGTVGALITKFDQWARWRDDRLLAEHRAATASAGMTTDAGALPFAAPAGMLTPPPGVAQEGRRLKRGVSWVTVAAAIVIGVVWIALRLIG
ncbi:hypothetical protein [Microbacterium hydrocarbonoxydans]|uniref:hypothetical protein n=1 Tax=Microbacterium hydrocarbonoxydans TaxID=273678 RepID=UPI003D982FF9